MCKEQTIQLKRMKTISTDGMSYELNILKKNRKPVERRKESRKPPWRQQTKLIKVSLLLRIIRNWSTSVQIKIKEISSCME